MFYGCAKVGYLQEESLNACNLRVVDDPRIISCEFHSKLRMVRCSVRCFCHHVGETNHAAGTIAHENFANLLNVDIHVKPQVLLVSCNAYVQNAKLFTSCCKLSAAHSSKCERTFTKTRHKCHSHRGCVIFRRTVCVTSVAYLFNIDTCSTS